MRRSVQDRMVDLVAARGEEGVGSAELAEVFLCPSSAPAALCERLIRDILTGDARVTQGEDGKWTARQGAAAVAAASTYTVIEATGMAAGARKLPLEWAAVQVDGQGHAGSCEGSGIRPDPWPEGLVLPPRLRGALRAAPVFREATAAAAKTARGSTIVAYRPGIFISGILKALGAEGEDVPVLSLARLGKRLKGREARSLEAMATILDVTVREPHTAAEKAQFTAEVLSAMILAGEELALGEPAGWVERQHPQRMEVDFSRYEFDREFLDGLPASPGIYVMRDGNGETVYVGKAVNLRSRVSGYFRARVSRDPKVERILDAVSGIAIEEAASELAALLAEYRAIQDLQPRINIQFEVHERRAAAQEPRRRVVLVVPGMVPEAAEVLLLHGNAAMRRVQAVRGDAERLRPLLTSFFFGGEPPQLESPTEAEELQIAWSWLERNADKVNGFDVDLAGGPDGAMEILARYLAEGPSQERVFHV